MEAPTHRKREYISPSSLAMFYEDPEKHYTRYTSPFKPENEPQNEPMSVGSAFDAFVKSYLHEGLFGRGNDPKYSFDALFTAQVEPHLRDWVMPHGKYCFEQYKSSGCLADLMSELKQAKEAPRFEFDLLGAVQGEKEPVSKTLASVPFLGKPDCHYINSAGASVIVDFKVNGYCSRNPPSPAPGYVRMRSANKFDHGMHKKCHPMLVNGTIINVTGKLNECGTTALSWAAQLSIYAWLLGEPIGSDFIVGIDQLVCNAVKSNPPTIRVAEHRSQISKQFQVELFQKAAHCWEVINSDHYFRDLSLEESKARCEALDQVAKGALAVSTHKDGDWFNKLAR